MVYVENRVKSAKDHYISWYFRYKLFLQAVYVYRIIGWV